MGFLFEGKIDSGRAETPPPPVPMNYSAPDLQTLYQQFREKGTVPYSYYGAGAPSNAEELARVKAAYPGAFSAPPPPPAKNPMPQPQAQRDDPFRRLRNLLGAR